MWPFRVVADTNVFVSAVNQVTIDRDLANGFQRPPSREFVDRAFGPEFVLLMSIGTYLELVEQLEEQGVAEKLILELAETLKELAQDVPLHTSVAFCADPDDDKFIHTAIDGGASHLVSADNDVKHGVAGRNLPFKTSTVVPFLRELRAELKKQLKIV